MGLLLLPLGDDYSLTALTKSLTFSRIPCWLTKLQTLKEKDTLLSPTHADGRAEAYGWKNTWVVPVQAMCMCCPCGALHPFQPLLPCLLWFTCMWF